MRIMPTMADKKIVMRTELTRLNHCTLLWGTELRI